MWVKYKISLSIGLKIIIMDYLFRISLLVQKFKNKKDKQKVFYFN